MQIRRGNNFIRTLEIEKNIAPVELISDLSSGEQEDDENEKTTKREEKKLVKSFGFYFSNLKRGEYTQCISGEGLFFIILECVLS